MINYKNMMKKYKIILLFILFPLISISQSFVPYNEIGVFIGGSYYIGDLNELHFNLTQPATGVFYKKNIDRRFAIKSSLLYGEIRGSDKTNKIDSTKINRNLHFKSPITELSAQVEFNFMNYETGNKKYSFSPYITSGISFYKFNPQARRYDTNTPFDNDNNGTSNPWIELQSLGTEGQHSASYPGRSPYMLSQFAIPLGVGFKISLSKNFSFSLEYVVRKVFTDYLDDVSLTYVDPSILYTESQIAASLSDRSINFQNWHTQNNSGIEYWDQNIGKNRGNENNWNDWFTFCGISIIYKFNTTPKVCFY